MKTTKSLKLTASLCVALLAASSANATVITMTFEGLGDFEYARNFYNGGLGGNGSGSGANYGVTFPGDTNTYLTHT